MIEMHVSENEKLSAELGQNETLIATLPVEN